MAGFLEGLMGDVIDGFVDGMAKGTVTRKRRRTTRRKTTRRKTTSRRKRPAAQSTLEKVLIEAITGKKSTAKRPRRRRTSARTKRRPSTARRNNRT